MTRVGIPQGLFYYYYYPLWKTFFQDLGAEVVCSEDTSRKTVEMGIQAAVDETCFPIKVYFGHVRELCSADVDYVFIPRIVSVEPRSYICPKFMGVPDMIRAAFPDLPPMISPVVDVSKTDQRLKKEIIQVGRLLTRKTGLIKKAYLHGLKELAECENLAAKGLTRTEAIRFWEGEAISIPAKWDLNIGVLGHGYSLYDKLISLNLINRLREMGCRVHLVEMMDQDMMEQQAATMPKRVFWTLGRRIVGSALCMKEQEDIDGIIYLACFGCGPDSLIGDIVERKVNGKPWMLLTIDEHTGEAGMVTRLEAFVDMLRRRKMINVKGDLPAYGKSTYCAGGAAGRIEVGGHSAAAYQ
ncbi:MAG: acyl-CoA dehydratase activase-related protein [Bacillota bacterium]|nr:acyl-CoA dehydratase activase-related protein [Bacillota bacterium]